MPAPDPSLDPRLARRRIRLSGEDEVWLRSVLDAYEGLALLYGDGSGTVTLATPLERSAELDSLLAELASEARLHVLASSG
jgi:hypothetical protein